MSPEESGPGAAIHSNVAGSHNKNVIIVGSYNNVSLANNLGLRLSRLHKSSGRASTPAQQLTAFERRSKFVGREPDLAKLQEWLFSTRLISIRTIVGPPGIGKTRLAIELADLAEPQGWISGFLRASELQRFVNAPGLSEWVWDRPTLVVVDYAAQKAEALGVLLEHLQDLGQAEQAPGSQKLRLLLLERDASPQSGWWAKAFGPSGQSDRRMELAEPQVPCPIAALSDETTLALITDTVGHGGKGSKLSPAAVLNACLRTEESRQILGNPLLVQIATISSMQKGTAELAFSTDALLGGIVDRERQLMRDKWRKAKIPEVLFKDLERLVATITLVQGATLQHVQELIGSVPTFSNLTSFLSLERMIQALSDALTFDDVCGYRALEPDIIGDRFIVDCDLDPELIQSAFKIDRFSLGPRLWRLLDEYQQDQRLGQRIADWVRRVIEHVEDILALDVFVSDAPSSISGVAAQVYAEARSKITEGLRLGKSTQESLLLRDDQKADLVARSLVREGFYLAKSGNHEEAIKRYDAAILDLIDSNFDQVEMLWVWTHSYRAESFDALGRQEERLAALDEAIAACHRLIQTGEFEDGAFVSESLKHLLENIEESHKVITERALRVVVEFSEPDIRIRLARLVIQRGDGTVSRAIVLDALTHLDDLAVSDVHSHLCNDASIFRDAALRCERISEIGHSKELWKHHNHFQQTAKSFLVDLLNLSLALRQLALSSKQDDEHEFGVDLARSAFTSLTTLICKGAILEPRHLVTMSVIFVCALPTAPKELLIRAVDLNKTDRWEAKADLAKQIADQMCSIAEEVGFLDRSDIRSELLTAVSRMTF